MNNITEPSKYHPLCLDCANHLIMDNRVLVRREYFEILQRLNDNVKKKILQKKEILYQIKQDPGFYRAIELQIELLKSLYNETTQES